MGTCKFRPFSVTGVPPSIVAPLSDSVTGVPPSMVKLAMQPLAQPVANALPGSAQSQNHDTYENSIDAYCALVMFEQATFPLFPSSSDRWRLQILR